MADKEAIVLDGMLNREFGLSLANPVISVGLNGTLSPLDGPWNGPAIVKKVYLFDAAEEKWLSPDLDARAEMAQIDARLAEVERRHPGEIHFVGGELLALGDNIESWVKRLGDIDAIMPVVLSAGVEPILAALAETGIPILLLALPFSGHSWSYVAARIREGKKGEVVATSDLSELDPYIRILRTIHHLRKSKVIAIAPSNAHRAEQAEAFTKQFETTFKFLSYEDLRDAYDAADLQHAEDLASSFMRGAVRVVEPSRPEIRDAMRMYLATVDLLKSENANALTIDCHSRNRPWDLPAYPCIALTKFNDQGMYGVCEGDLLSTMTQLLVTSYSGKPGFVSDPVFDTSRNEVIHAHCAAPTAMHGVGSPGCQYIVRSHSEDRKSVAIQVLMPIGEIITIAKFTGPKELLVSTAHVAGNVDGDRGCRTKILTRVSDARKMLDNYAGGLHRVIFYGDYVDALERMSRLMGFKVVREL